MAILAYEFCLWIIIEFIHSLYIIKNKLSTVYLKIKLLILKDIFYLFTVFCDPNNNYNNIFIFLNSILLYLLWGLKKDLIFFVLKKFIC